MISIFEYIDSAYTASDAADSTLNMRIGSDEVSYYINNAQAKISLQRHTSIGANMLEELEEVLSASELTHAFSTVRISIEEAFTLVPSDIFRPSDILSHYKNNLGYRPEKELQFDQLKNEGVVVVYGIDKKLLELLKQKFNSYEYYNAHSVLLDSLYRENGRFSNMKQVFVNFRKKTFSFTCLNNEKLIYSNVFSYKWAEDILYYIVKTADELNLDLNSQECIFTGSIEHTDGSYKLLNDYLNKIEFIKRPSELSYSDEHFRRLPSNAFFDLYSMSRCA